MVSTIRPSESHRKCMRIFRYNVKSVCLCVCLDQLWFRWCDTYISIENRNYFWLKYSSLSYSLNSDWCIAIWIECESFVRKPIHFVRRHLKFVAEKQRSRKNSASLWVWQAKMINRKNTLAIWTEFVEKCATPAWISCVKELPWCCNTIKLIHHFDIFIWIHFKFNIKCWVLFFR